MSKMREKSSHRKKVKLARKMRTKAELKSRVPIFQTEGWEKRREVKRRKLIGKKLGLDKDSKRV